jgi:hypothetical protein
MTDDEKTGDDVLDAWIAAAPPYVAALIFPKDAEPVCMLSGDDWNASGSNRLPGNVINTMVAAALGHDKNRDLFLELAKRSGIFELVN